MSAKKEDAVPAKPAFKPKVVKHVTLPTLKLVPDVPVYITILDAMFEGKAKELTAEEKKDGKKPDQPPTIMNVLEFTVNDEGTALETTGEPSQIVVGTVLEKELKENYEKDSYVGKTFMVEKGKKKGTGQRGYFVYTIQEIEAPKT